ncbi:hypothetical protein [Entomobacter blattae]|uniref:Uncharacterized protein n=1 Tax=Entomobacter blattae TaxID=2762277 RepID=A0A7H1NQW3_9PROT|nr:hypothetical protein [Entomobacter blattae]QNT78173.1 hypothetical protein JGUZn3_09420 [Entomobacter blattae]
MFVFFKNLAKRLVQKEHWYAEFWSSIVFICYALWAKVDMPEAHREWPPDLGFTHVLPDTVWQGIMLVTGVGQLISLGVEKPFLRGFFSVLAFWLACWVTLNIYSFGYGFHPGLALSLGWAGVNVFAFSRSLGGMR